MGITGSRCPRCFCCFLLGCCRRCRLGGDDRWLGSVGWLRPRGIIVAIITPIRMRRLSPSARTNPSDRRGTGIRLCAFLVVVGRLGLSAVKRCARFGVAMASVASVPSRRLGLGGGRTVRPFYDDLSTGDSHLFGRRFLSDENSFSLGHRRLSKCDSCSDSLRDNRDCLVDSLIDSLVGRLSLGSSARYVFSYRRAGTGVMVGRRACPQFIGPGTSKRSE